ncbi:hypothetical protein [Streptacidiphilus sp. MAP12-16]|uniref:hypothetical protein n=1 Tax=Streptacidiphilus sp. MAP12-16 TaxID=3156300 RepID=UPI0035146EDC
MKKALPGVAVFVGLMVAVPLAGHWLGVSHEVIRPLIFGLSISLSTVTYEPWRKYGTSRRAEEARRKAEALKAVRAARRKN